MPRVQQVTPDLAWGQGWSRERQMRPGSILRSSRSELVREDDGENPRQRGDTITVMREKQPNV